VANAGRAVPYPGEVDEAKRHPNGWVYRIASTFQRNEAVPPEAIIGAWKVGPDGRIVGEFIRNLKYNPEKWPPKMG
jgi:hypothetical protein